MAWLLPHSCPGPTVVNLTATDSLSIMAHNAKYDTNMDWCVGAQKRGFAALGLLKF